VLPPNAEEPPCRTPPLELLARADRVQAEAHIQIALSRELPSQSASLLRCLNDGLVKSGLCGDLQPGQMPASPMRRAAHHKVPQRPTRIS
jgi:hypothetical protein